MSSAKFYEQQATGIASHNGALPVVGQNQRLLNFSSGMNDIIGMYLTPSNTVFTPLGRYKIRARSPAHMVGASRLVVWDFTNNVPLITGTSESTGIVGPLGCQVNVYCEASDTIGITNPLEIGLMLYVQNLATGSSDYFGLPVSDGALEMYSSIEFDVV